MNTNLDHLIHDAKFKEGMFNLNDAQRADILRMIGKGCRFETKEKLAQKLKLPLLFWRSYGIYSRITLNDVGADYCCGQSWTDEMRTLRECILSN